MPRRPSPFLPLLPSPFAHCFRSLLLFFLFMFCPVPDCPPFLSARWTRRAPSWRSTPSGRPVRPRAPPSERPRPQRQRRTPRRQKKRRRQRTPLASPTRRRRTRRRPRRRRTKKKRKAQRAEKSCPCSLEHDIGLRVASQIIELTFLSTFNALCSPHRAFEFTAHVHFAVMFPSHRACVRRPALPRVRRACPRGTCTGTRHATSPRRIPPTRAYSGRACRWCGVRFGSGANIAFGSNAMSLYCQILHKTGKDRSSKQAIVSCCLLAPSLRSPSHSRTCCFSFPLL